MGVGHQRNEQSDRDLELSVQPPGSLGSGEKETDGINNQWFNQSCLQSETSIKQP